MFLERLEIRSGQLGYGLLPIKTQRSAHGFEDTPKAFLRELPFLQVKVEGGLKRLLNLCRFFLRRAKDVPLEFELIFF